MSLTESFRSLTSAESGVASRISQLPRSARWSLGVIAIIALYLTPYWPRVPVLGVFLDTGFLRHNNNLLAHKVCARGAPTSPMK